jgi:glycosyltransferase involved in cell wall biosynthesis
VRVVHLTSRHPADDVRIFLKECRSLARAGFETHLVAPGAVEQVRDGVAVHGFAESDGVRPLRIARRLWRSWRAAHAVRPDLCQFHEPELVPVALLLKLAGTRIVYDVHEDALSELEYAPNPGGGRRIGLRVFEALARRACDAFVAATPAIARLFPPDRTVEVLNYPLEEEFVEGVERASNGGDVVYVGGIITRPRGLLEMVEAMNHVRNPHARLVLIGTVDPPELETEARSNAGWSRVDHPGPLGRRELLSRLATARVGLVVLHPERGYKESLPIKLFEYMSAGLPVIASDFPYWRELLDPIGCAVFVNALDPKQIAAAIDDLLGDEERAQEMGQLGAAAVRERLNWEHEEQKLLDLYRRLSPAAVAA